MNPLVAILLGLAVLVIGTLGYFQIYGSASSNANAQNATQVIQSIFANVAQSFASDPNNFTGFDVADAIQSGIVPSSWVPAGQTTKILDPWGGTVNFEPASIQNGINNAWLLTLNSVPPSACAQLATFYTPQTFGINVNGVDVGVNPAYNGGTTAYVWPPAPATVQAACDETTNYIQWYVSGQ